jgi:hypothetical protein
MELPLIALVVSLAAASSAAQWPPYTTPSAPQTPDAKPNLNGHTPRTPDGKPDLSGIWKNKLQAGGRQGAPGRWQRAAAGDFFNIGAGFKDARPLFPALGRRHGEAAKGGQQQGQPRRPVFADGPRPIRSNRGTAYNGNFGLDGSTWLRPTAILNARFVQFSVTVNC